MDKETRWMDKEVLTTFFSSMNQFFANKNEKCIVYIFGGGALCLHGLREKTNDFDTATLLENDSPNNYFEAIKKHCLQSIGINDKHILFNTTYNDSTSTELPKEALPRFKEFLDKKKQEFNFELMQEYSHVKVIAPPKEYLLINRLLDLQYDNPKTHLDKIDCINLLKDLKIDDKNKEEFLIPYNNNPRIDTIKTKLDEMITLSTQQELIKNNIKSIREQLLEDNRIVNHKKESGLINK